MEEEYECYGPPADPRDREPTLWDIFFNSTPNAAQTEPLDLSISTPTKTNTTRLWEPMEEDEGEDISFIGQLDSVAAYLEAPTVITISSDDEDDSSADSDADTIELELHTPQPQIATEGIKAETNTPTPWYSQVFDMISWLEESIPTDGTPGAGEKQQV